LGLREMGRNREFGFPMVRTAKIGARDRVNARERSRRELNARDRVCTDEAIQSRATDFLRRCSKSWPKQEGQADHNGNDDQTNAKNSFKLYGHGTLFSVVMRQRARVLHEKCQMPQEPKISIKILRAGHSGPGVIREFNGDENHVSPPNR